MPNFKRYQAILKGCAALLMVGLFFYGSADLFIIMSLGIYIVMVLRALCIPSKKRLKLIMIISYTFLLPVQVMINEGIGSAYAESELQLIGRLLSLLGVAVPFMIESFFIVNQYASFYMPSLQDLSSFSLNELLHGREKISYAFSGIYKVGQTLSPENIEKLAADLPRHNSFRYINDGTLTDGYFEEAYASLDDPRLYIVISNTGSAASELISIFTRKQYNHASLSFDADLKTIISYNGGERVYPPGLNREMMEFFYQKKDASIIVYYLDMPSEQKRLIIDKIKEINTEGSAYNVMGLVLKYSHRANIMFCSQFVYEMLRHVGLNYFEKQAAKVSPTDLVELDYYRKLKYAYEIKF